MKGKPISEMAPQFGGRPVLQGLISAFVVAILAVLLTAVLVTWTSIREANVPTITYVINVIAVVIGSFSAARKEGQRGWYFGGMTGLLYSTLITLIGIMLAASTFTFHHVVQIIILSLIGGFGGMIGVNLGRK